MLQEFVAANRAELIRRWRQGQVSAGLASLPRR
jgi:hypothetical protein